MMQEILLHNIGTVTSLVLMICSGLILLGTYKKEFQILKKLVDEHIEEYREHLAEELPHKSCVAETIRRVDVSKSIDELRKSISRVEGWVMALAASQGIKSPMSNGD